MKNPSICAIFVMRGDFMDNLEIERKFVIELPDFEKMRKMSGYAFSDITQVYMKTVKGVSHRIRKRDGASGTVYTETKKTRIDEMTALEEECEIEKERYEELYSLRDEALRVITKRRHVFEYMGQIFEIDVYPEWQRSCIMETELKSKSQFPQIPDFISIVRDVTGVREYSNHSMARIFPKEII